MFTVKFVTEQTPDKPDERIELHQCASVRVYCEQMPPAPDTMTSSGPMKARERSTMHVELVDDQRRAVSAFHIDHGQFNWNVAYVLNDKGKTIQTIVPNVPV